ncbi:MAG: methyltransferase domain-containing protein [Gammaproteobacteria bacterium]|nr:methyltransferase domain-containing protein [Gammaproteobacteria bacterium]
MGTYDKESDSQLYWNEEGGSKWVENIDLVETMMVPMSDELLNAIAAKSGEQVLDVGCGGGVTSMKLAQQVGEEGKVIGVDVSEPILSVARDRAAGIANIEFEHSDATSAKLGKERFDIITSRFGVMFFDDPVIAFSNMHGSLKPEGRLVFMCWRGIEENPWLGATAKAAFDIVGAPAEKPDPKAPGPFSLGDSVHLQNILQTSGFHSVNLTATDKTMPMGSLDNALGFLMKMGPVAEAIKEASVEQKELVTSAVSEVLSSFNSNKGLMVPGATWIVTASK